MASVIDLRRFRFMQGLRDGTAVSNRTKHQTFLVPLALGLGPGGSEFLVCLCYMQLTWLRLAFFISRAIKSKIRRRKLAYAIDLISTWNQVSQSRLICSMRLTTSCRISLILVVLKLSSCVDSVHSRTLSWQHNPRSQANPTTTTCLGCLCPPTTIHPAPPHPTRDPLAVVINPDFLCALWSSRFEVSSTTTPNVPESNIISAHLRKGFAVITYIMPFTYLDLPNSDRLSHCYQKGA
jgi:hypothetical protein